MSWQTNMKRFICGGTLMGFAIGALCAAEVKTQGPGLIPRPQKMELGSGVFTLTAQTALLASAEARPAAEALKTALAPVLGGAAEVKDLPAAAPEGAIALRLKADPALGAEGYRLEVTATAIQLQAAAPAGLFWGVQTLRQLIPEHNFIASAPTAAKVEIPGLKIEDVPRFARRGLLLDCCRHFFTVAEVKGTIDKMVRYKMNVLHWHLTDDQGWRIEIKKYPKLTQVGSQRIGENGKLYPDGKPQGGFYTQAEVREIVAYAAARFVTVVPEIEMPGHSTAVLACYPELSCTGGPFEVSTHWGVHKEVLCAGNDKTFEFLQDVLTEVLDLFPAKEIHLGGDECPKDRWKACPKCQARIKSAGLKDEKELQSYFIRRMVKFLNDHGRRAICWDEVLEEGLHEGIMVQEWRGHKPAPEGSAAKAAMLKMDVVVSPAPTWYLDMPVLRDDGAGKAKAGKTAKAAKEAKKTAAPKAKAPATAKAAAKKGKYTWGRPSTLADAYGLDPMPEGLAPEFQKYILGGEGCLWTEHINPARADFFAFPRVLAIAEALWSPAEGKQFDEFYGRVKAHYPRLKAMGIHYGPAFPEDLKTLKDPGGEL